jgi:hypothetical protein
MSEPLGTEEIEDVVSSVRRLVAPQAQPRPISRLLGTEPLVLTAALRVVSDVEAAPLTPLVLEGPLVQPPADAEAEPVAQTEPVPEPEPEAVAPVTADHAGDLADGPVDSPPVAGPAQAVRAAAEAGDVVPFPLVAPSPPPRAVPDEAIAAVPAEEVEAIASDLPALDEGAVAKLVRTIIREELQGALGERITQNVRKLVRAEINRALAARALD